MRLVLHTYWRSSASHRVRLALGFKGLSYEPVFVNLLESEQL
jgi:maleylacetoacetate isomerase